MPKRLFLVCVYVLFLAGVLICGEAACRIIFGDNFLSRIQDERNLLYSFDEHLGWFPIPNAKQTYLGSHLFQIENNSLGFRDNEFALDERPRIALLGDSFVWGYDVEQDERLSEHLQAKLPDWEVLNLGVSGYGPDQELVLLEQWFDRLRPQIVVLVFCSDNDFGDNTSNVVYGGYYKPYYRVGKSALHRLGQPVPKSKIYTLGKHPLAAKSYLYRLVVDVYYQIKNPAQVQLDDPTKKLIVQMNSFLEARGAKLVVALTSSWRVVEDAMQKEGVPIVVLSGAEKFPGHGSHWTPKGHRVVAEQIHQLLLDSRLLEGD